MAPVSLALFWHHHQPYYPDDVAGENPMPWVRLHATKDYLGMALHLEEVPEFSCTINLVPSLLAQIQAYVNGASDTHLDVVAPAGRRPGGGRRLLRARQLLHGQPGYDDPAASPLPRTFPDAIVVGLLGQAGTAPVPASRPARPSGLVEPGVDSPPALREGPRAGRVQEQRPVLHRGREAMVSGQTARAGRAG